MHEIMKLNRSKSACRIHWDACVCVCVCVSDYLCVLVLSYTLGRREQVDLPGHANGLLPLKQSGATFCADSQMYADSAGKTNGVLIALIKEYAELFGSQVRI